MTELYFFLQSHTWVALGFTFIFALLVGSFLNVVIYRLPAMMEREWQSSIEDYQQDAQETQTPALDDTRFNLATPSSRCGQCNHQIRWYENIPLISYLVLRGKCSQCKTRISLRYPTIELLTALLSVAVIFVFGFNVAGLAAVAFTFCLVSLTFIDIDHHLLPDRITLPLLWLGLLVNTQNIFTSLESAVWGAILGYLSLWSVYWAFKIITKKEGMGYGDFKLLAALGAWCGAMALPLIILLSSVAGVIIAVVLMATKKHHSGNPLPFGPYLAIAGWVALLFGQSIIGAYLGSF
ncbi:A24 family peptidase [Neptunomonas phycophila]|uniref:prepilin peptidase n=1 Tax=Neptunomonas phycophila TaxID=1572645 RepID=UPI0026E42064|nr:A24 family peptidase [Neptunomonas phycophila]MDO6467335.1 A24 family peptidase [Neptunomonas phycophila]